MPGRDWEEHTRRRKEAEERRTALSEEIRRAKSEFGRLERIRGALTSLGRRKELQKQRADMGDVLILPAGFPERRRATLKALSGAREVQAKAQTKLEELESQIEALIVPTALLDEADAVTELHQLMGSHVKAMQDLPKRIGEAEQLETDAAAILDDIRPGATAEEADSFKVGLAKRKSVRELGGRHEALLQVLHSAGKSVETLQAKIEQARNNLTKTDAPRDPSALKDLLKRVRRLGDLEADVEKTRGKLAAETKQAGIEMQRLPLWSGTLDQLETMAVPDDETVTRFEKELAEIEQQSRAVESRLNEMLMRESELAGKLMTLELTTAVPTEEDLAEARLRREAGWKLVRAAWLEGGGPQAEVEAFGGGEPLDQAYEKSVHHADEMADRLRREAERVAQHASLVSERDRTGQEIRRLTEEGKELSKAQLNLQGEWQELWRAGGIDPLPPREMRSWMQKQRALVQRAERIRASRQEIDNAETQIAKLSGEIVADLKRMGEKEPEPTLDLNALLDHSQNVCRSDRQRECRPTEARNNHCGC